MASQSLQTVPINYPYPFNLNVANFVSIKLTQSNFLLWQTQVLGLIESQDMTGFVNGETPMPDRYLSNGSHNGGNITAAEQVLNLDFNAWQRSDRLLHGWITGTLSEEILGLVVGLKTSKQID
ncbi:hypothetical protein EJ110_NYTH53154 [Nymphaea thermarum]|nr:hypothetical protein EJ110_NYTH53154 [Nymphaea thermarum]